METFDTEERKEMHRPGRAAGLPGPMLEKKTAM